MKHLSRLMLVVLIFIGNNLYAQPKIRVRGIGIDIWNVGNSGYRLMFPKGTRTGWEEDYYISGQVHLYVIRPSEIVDIEYATTPLQSEDERKNCSLDSLIADAAGPITIAISKGDLNVPGWTKTTVSFNSSILTYYLYTYNYTTPNSWLKIPYNDPNSPTILFGERGHLKFDNPLPIYDLAEGIIIDVAYDEYNRSDYIVDPDMLILSNGDYIAGEKLRRHISKDKGKTWMILNENEYHVEHASTFEHKGALYIIGDEEGGSAGRGAINKSTDGGKTWATPVILLDDFRNSPSHVEFGNDRIWIAYENLPSPHTVNFLSASVDSDLMDPNSWVTTIRQDNVGTGNETDLVMGRNAYPIAMPKSGGPVVRALSATEAKSNGSSDTFNLPHSSSKYTAKYDSVSDKYWALTSNSEIHPGEDRRTGITLWNSVDLKTWTKVKLVFQGTSSSFHGFNYPSMQFDGNDIIFVLRTAWENEMGQAQRWHDANMLTFHRLRNFRNILAPTASFVQPAINTRISKGDNLAVIVNAKDSNSLIAKVDLYLNNKLVGTDTDPPYEWGGANDALLQNLAVGFYTLKAVSTGIDGENVTVTRTFNVGTRVSEIGVQVEGAGFTKRLFANHTEFFANRTYVILNAPDDFNGFEFLASDGKETNPGVIKPLEDGFVYIAAPGGGIKGWDIVPNANFNYNDGGQTSLSVYQKLAFANSVVYIPEIIAFPGASVIAKTIELNVVTGITDLEVIDAFNDNALIVYPNPASHSFNIRFTGAEKADISIFNLFGKQLRNHKYLGGIINIQTGSILKKGIYLIKLITASGKIFTEKLIING